MNPKNGYEARLAKMAGDENVTIPKPTNAYMKYMDDIEDGGGGGSALPAVTAADNGKVLTVIEGAWDKAAGGNMFIVHATYNWDDNTNAFVLAVKEDVEDIATAILAGRYTEMHLARYNADPATNFSVYPLLWADLNDESAIGLEFGEGLSGYLKNVNYVELKSTLIYYQDGSWSYDESTKNVALYPG